MKEEFEKWNRASFVVHRGREILILDFSNIETGVELRSVIDASIDYVTKSNKRDLSILVDVRGTNFYGDGYRSIQRAGEAIRPLLHRDAVVWNESLSKQVLLQIANTRRRLSTPAFSSRLDAMNYLADVPVSNASHSFSSRLTTAPAALVRLVKSLTKRRKYS